MKSSLASVVPTLLFAVVAALSLSNAYVVPQHQDTNVALFEDRSLSPETRIHLMALNARSNPTGSYAPSMEACPSIDAATTGATNGFIRDASDGTISPQEADYVQRHLQATQQAWEDFLKSSSPGPNLDGALPGGAANYTSDISRLPRVGIALSGGGYRAMINGAGFISGLDSRVSSAQSRGTAGMLQLASYAAGLSGGSWAVGSFAINDWPTAQTLANDTWNLDQNLIIPSDDTIGFYADLVSDVAAKRDEGYPTAITDYWGRALSYHLVNSTYPKEGQATTFADIRNTTNFESAAYPFPIVISDERNPGQLLIYRNTTLFEFSPYEFGSYSPDVQAFVPIEILGTSFNDGAAPENGSCVYGFDNFGWVVGTSSTLFNGLYNMLIQNQGDSLIKDALESVLQDVSGQDNDVSVVPNPFQGYTGGANFSLTSPPNITLVDGGEDDQNIPLAALLEPGRQLDLILANDNSADVTDFPNGTAIHETFLRFQNGQQFNTVPMPKVPSPNTFVNRGLNTRPTLFGCNATTDVINTKTAINDTLAPIIAYIPNYPYSTLSNTSTFQLEYDTQTTNALLENGANVATLGGATNASSDLYWPRCLACAALERSFQRSNTPRPDACERCLQAYCWDGVTNDTVPAQAYSPPVGTPAFITSNGQTQTAPKYTGGNGSNADQSGAMNNEKAGSNSTNAAAPPLRPVSSLLALLVVLFATLMLA